ncbi:unnamed protein product [Protopolystoma xenopodis]|uniref:RING-type domain-containing protein n=1 Tax=Protopolystoma xenopodis TaxID=117903 RepID=A0A448WYJ3_9PLAT|nr:unnamed protein product [Protopolystoma xenopodis]
MSTVQLPGVTMYSSKRAGDVEDSTTRRKVARTAADSSKSRAPGSRGSDDYVSADLISYAAKSWASHLKGLRQLLVCSVCYEYSRELNQCSNGHLFCPLCTVQLEQTRFANRLACTCPICRVPLTPATGFGTTSAAESASATGGLQRSRLAQGIASRLPEPCRYCGAWLAPDRLVRHEALFCGLRPTVCPFALLGCSWRGNGVARIDHLVGRNGSDCPVWRMYGTEMYRSTKAGRRADRAEVSKWLPHLLLLRLAGRVGEESVPGPEGLQWQSLQTLLETSREASFGMRGAAGLRVVPVLAALTRKTTSKLDTLTTDPVFFVSSPICLPLHDKLALWLRVSWAEQTLLDSSYSAFESTISQHSPSSYTYFVRRSNVTNMKSL